MVAPLEWPFVVALAFACLLVLGTSLGLVGDDTLDADGDGVPDALEGFPSLLTILGFGRAPVGVSLVLLFGSYGAIGLVTALVVAIPLAHGIAALAALGLHRAAAGLFARLVPSVETYASRPTDRFGRQAVVVLRLGRSDAIVRVRLDDGTELRVRADGDGAELALGDEVVIVDHDPATRRDRVVPLPPEARRLPASNPKEIVP